jgi:hypothetical protein
MEQKQVFVRTLSGKTVVVDGPQIDDTLESLENKIRLACAAENEELPLDTRIRFSVAGVPVEELTGESVRLLAEGQPLELNVALIGGKVHGSLARAGFSFEFCYFFLIINKSKFQERSAHKLQRLKKPRREKRSEDEHSEECNTTSVSSTLQLLKVADEDQMHNKSKKD